jgi:hypothetical protein
VKGLVQGEEDANAGVGVSPDGRDEKRRKRIVDSERLVDGEHWHEQYQRVI